MNSGAFTLSRLLTPGRRAVRAASATRALVSKRHTALTRAFATRRAPTPGPAGLTPRHTTFSRHQFVTMSTAVSADESKDGSTSSVRVLSRSFEAAKGCTEAGVTAARADPASFVAMHWNVLADGLAQYGSFVKLADTPEVLEWEYRQPLIVQEVAAAAPDLLSVVEMNRFEEFAAALKPLGMEGQFVEKTSSPCARFGAAPDGAAVFVRSERFKLVRVIPVPFHFADGKIMNQRGLLAVIEDKAVEEGTEARRIVVAAVHLKAKHGEVEEVMRTTQVTQILEAASKLVDELGSGTEMLLQGDFNTEPSSPAYALSVKSPLGLTSAYGPDGEESEPPITTWKFRPAKRGAGLHEAKHTIDYIFHTAGLTPRELFKLPTEEEMGSDALPSATYPSDHLSLAARFQWAATSK